MHETQFKKIIQRGGYESRNGYYGLGQTYSAQEKYSEAISQFERAVQKDKSFYSAYAEMGYTYADAGEMDKAKEISGFLESKDASLSATLDGYISKATKPKILFAYADSTFPYFSMPNTQISTIDSYLANAGTQQTFTMTFQFNKAMDRASVENNFNWTINRSKESQPGMRYNNGLPVAPTETNLPPYPTNVTYDADKFIATVRFNIYQNANADGTIDPSHIVFSFSGSDDDGNDMDFGYDQYMGFSGSF